MSANSPETEAQPTSRGKALLHTLWGVYQCVAIWVGTMFFCAVGIFLYLQAEDPLNVAFIEKEYHIPTRALYPVDTELQDTHALLIHTSAAFDEAAFTADLLAAGWKPRPHEQDSRWRSFEHLGMTLRLFPGGLFVFPSWREEPCSEPTHLRGIILPAQSTGNAASAES